MTFGQRIEQLRREKGWTQVEFARRLGVHDRHISRWEKGKNRPMGRTLEKMAEVFGMSVDELFGRIMTPSDQEPNQRLLQQFKEIQGLPASEREAISVVLDAFITKKRMAQVLNAAQP